LSSSSWQFNWESNASDEDLKIINRRNFKDKVWK
jgi:hypothetical protein